MTLGNDNGTDGQTDGQTDRQSATHNAAPSYGGGPHKKCHTCKRGLESRAFLRPSIHITVRVLNCMLTKYSNTFPEVDPPFSDPAFFYHDVWSCVFYPAFSVAPSL